MCVLQNPAPMAVSARASVENLVQRESTSLELPASVLQKINMRYSRSRSQNQRGSSPSPDSYNIQNYRSVSNSQRINRIG